MRASIVPTGYETSVTIERICDIIGNAYHNSEAISHWQLNC